MFDMLKRKKPSYITVTLNAKLQPLDRGELEDAFTDFCQNKGIKADVVGGGTLTEKNGEVTACDIEIQLDKLTEERISEIKGIFEAMLAPKGSYITVSETGEKINFGHHEGLGLYLNGTDLSDEIYATCDSNYVYEECERLIKGIGMINSHWQGQTETALYIYGKNFIEIYNAISPLIDSYPLCQKARVEQLA